MKIIDAALEIYDDLGEPEDIALPTIAFWMETKIGKLNSLIGTCYTLVNHQVSPELDIEEAAILEEMYRIRYYEGKINENLGAAGTAIIEVMDGDSKIRLASKTEVARYFDSQKKDSIKALDGLIFAYNASHSGPRSVNFSQD